LRYADGSNPLRQDKSSIEWKHEGFGVNKDDFRPGASVRGEPALCADGPAAVGGADNRRFDNEAGERHQGESDSDEGKIHRRACQAEYGSGGAKKTCEPKPKRNR
jgi:hypothetical protein